METFLGVNYSDVVQRSPHSVSVFNQYIFKIYIFKITIKPLEITTNASPNYNMFSGMWALIYVCTLLPGVADVDGVHIGDRSNYIKAQRSPPANQPPLESVPGWGQVPPTGSPSRPHPPVSQIPHQTGMMKRPDSLAKNHMYEELPSARYGLLIININLKYFSDKYASYQSKEHGTIQHMEILIYVCIQNKRYLKISQ